MELDPDRVNEWLLSKGWYRCRCKKWAYPDVYITCWSDEWAIEHQMKLDLGD